LEQLADAASGDGVAGLVAGVVTARSADADVVLDNSSSDSRVRTGDATFTNDGDAFVGAGIRIGSDAPGGLFFIIIVIP
jgi:hypothetical protein